jgi:hypothetical protein
MKANPLPILIHSCLTANDVRLYRNRTVIFCMIVWPRVYQTVVSVPSVVHGYSKKNSKANKIETFPSINAVT